MDAMGNLSTSILGVEDLPEPPIGKVGWPWTENPAASDEERTWPSVSLVVPSYQKGRYLEESIRSVLLQGYPDLEMTVIDGGSTDESLSIIQKYEPWLKYWVSEKDRGQCHAINTGLAHSTGYFFNWHNADDVLLPGSIYQAVRAFLEHPGSSYVHGACLTIDEKSEYGQIHGHKHGFSYTTKTGPFFEESVLRLKSGIQPGCLMLRSLVVEHGALDSHLHYVMDRDLLLRLAMHKPPVYIDAPLVAVRDYPEAKSRQANAQRACERLAVAKKIFREATLKSDVKKLKAIVFANAHRFAWQIYLEAGMPLRALYHLMHDVMRLPFRDWKSRKKVYRKARHIK